MTVSGIPSREVKGHLCTTRGPVVVIKLPTEFPTHKELVTCVSLQHVHDDVALPQYHLLSFPFNDYLCHPTQCPRA